MPKDGNYVDDKELILQISRIHNAYLHWHEKEVEELNDDPNAPAHFHRRKNLRHSLVPCALRLTLATLGITHNHCPYLQKRTEHEHQEGNDDGTSELGEKQTSNDT